MKYKIKGNDMQVVEIELEKGEELFSEAGGMSWMSEGIEMKTNTRGGVLKGLGRMFSGESFFLNTFVAEKKSNIAFSSEFPGKILAFDLSKGKQLICQKDSFMVAEKNVDLKLEFKKKLGAGLFGGEGFILQRVQGKGTVFLESAGELIEKTLKPKETIKVDTGHVAFFEDTVKYDIQMVKGIKNIFFGGEGLFLTTLEGPGKIWLQSMPLKNLARKIAQYLPAQRSNTSFGSFDRD